MKIKIRREVLADLGLAELNDIRIYMKRLIIIDGCDRTGKTTFIGKLNNKLKELNYIPFVFHLMGPNKFKGLNFNNDEKSLIQLSKFNDELDLFKVMLESN